MTGSSRAARCQSTTQRTMSARRTGSRPAGRMSFRQGADRSAGIVRQSASMTSRRDQRQTHVRPRPPSTGRPPPAKGKPRRPGPIRISPPRPIDRGGRSPLVARMGLIALVLALGAVVFYVGLKTFPTAAGGLGSAVTGFIGNVVAPPTPKPSVVPIADAPTLALP